MYARPSGLVGSSQQALQLCHSFHFSHPPGALVPVQRDPSISERVPKVIRGRLLGNSFQVSWISSWLAALATAARPSYRFVNVLTLTFRFLQVLTLFIFKHLRFQRLQEKLLLAPSSAEIGHSTALGLWQRIVFARATCAWTLTISAKDTALPLKLRVLTRLSLGFAPSDRGRFLSL